METLKIGDEVQLKSGGCYMIINGFADNPRGDNFGTELKDYCFCVWKDNDDKHQENYYHKDGLKKVERDAGGSPIYRG